MSVFKNECISYFKSRWIAAFSILAFSVIIFSVIDVSSMDGKNMNYLNYIAKFINPMQVEGGIMAFIIPILTIVIAVWLFAADEETGVMKFMLLTGVGRIQFLIEKIIFQIFTIAINIMFMFTTVTIAGAISTRSFAGLFSERYMDLMGKFLFNFLAVIPTMLICVLISQLMRKFEKALTISVMIFFFFTLIDNLFPEVKFLSPTYSELRLMFVSTDLHIQIMHSLISSLGYSVILLAANIIIIRRKDFWI